MTDNLENIKLGNNKDELAERLTWYLVKNNFGGFDSSDVIDIITKETPYNAHHYLLLQTNDENVIESYRFVETNAGTLQLTDVSQGTAYVILKPIMMEVFGDEVARSQVTNIMANAYSPLDLLITQKGATGDELTPEIAKLNKWELKELHDFVDGMKVALRTAQTTSPAGADSIYPTNVDIPSEFAGDYDDAEAEAYLEDEIEPQSDTVIENNIMDMDSKKEKSLANKLLSIFKRK